MNNPADKSAATKGTKPGLRRVLLPSVGHESRLSGWSPTQVGLGALRSCGFNRREDGSGTRINLIRFTNCFLSQSAKVSAINRPSVLSFSGSVCH